MNSVACRYFLLCLATASMAAPPQNEGKGDEALTPESGNEVAVDSVSPPPEDENEKLTPNQQGRLARFNGNFFQLYGATNQLDGNLDAIAGNQLAFRGNLIEFLGNEHSLRQLGAFLGEVQSERQAKAERATGREKEREDEEVSIVGQLKDLVVESAGKEHRQAQEKAKQFNLETRQYTLEKEELALKADQTVSELEQGNLEEQQIALENKGRRGLQRLGEIQKEREAEEAAATTATAPA